VGLAITQAISLIGMCNWGLRQTAELESQMTSVERIVEYSRLPSERPLKSSPEILKTLPQNWPARGSIGFKNVSMKYTQEGDYVLKDLKFEVRESVRFWFHPVMVITS
jgi:ATP-binding cassette, subfamily C (CFTR/MRP), member 4